MKKIVFLAIMLTCMSFLLLGCGNSIAGTYVSIGDGLYYSDDWKYQLDKDNSLEYISDENAGEQTITLGEDGSYTYEAYGNTYESTYSKESEQVEIDGIVFDLYTVEAESETYHEQLLFPKNPEEAHGADVILNMGGILTYLKKE